jgi:CubicO group peptidase (beta-lactamase class C family)
MNTMLIRWFAGVAMGLLLMPLLAACGNAPATSSGATAAANARTPTSTPIPTTASAPALDTAALDAYVTRLMRDYDVPGVGLAIVQHGQIAYTQGYGVRDVSTGAPVTPNTQFAIGSITKSFTALGVMLLVQEGKVKLDDPVTKYLPEFKLSDPAVTAKVTVCHLLSHTTGLATNFNAQLDANLIREAIVKSAASTPLHSQPGERYEYNNMNTTIAGFLIERMSGQSWEGFTRQRILTPLGMATATLDVDAMQQTTDFARPHVMDVLKGIQPTSFLSQGGLAPAGAINANAAEMARYIQFQLGDGTVNGQPLLSPDLLAAMHQPRIDAPSENYGLKAAQAAKAQGLPAPTNLISDTGYGFY